MSATPIITNSESRIVVDVTDVIEAGIIKKEVIINKDIDQIPTDDIDSQKLIMLAAFNKREEMVSRYHLQGSDVNPLV